MDQSTANDLPDLALVLVATDFSEHATRALDLAIEITRLHGARLAIVHAVDAAPITGTSLELQTAVQTRLDELTARVRDAGLEVDGTFRAGRPWEVVTEAAADGGADLIVLGTRGHTPYPRLLLGRTADRVIRLASVPVLTVPPAAVPGALTVETILVPTDFSDGAARATEAAMTLLRGASRPRRLVLLHAWQPFVEYEFDAMGGVLTSQLDQAETQARTELEVQARRLQCHGVEVETVVRQGYPARVIETEAAALGADLIAIGTHGRTGLERLLLGSVAERVLHHAPCPVLSVHHLAVEATRDASR